MKSKESLDDAGKVEELSSTTAVEAMPGDTSIIENKRRRLVRGAVAFAPLVLTLRSGALAAASCTGAKLVRVNANNRIPANAGVTTSDVCFPSAAICEGSPTVVGPTKVNSVPKPTGFPITANPNGTLNCTSGTDLSRTRIAILSTTSASSLGFRP